MSKPEIVVIGAGAAGVFTCYELSRANRYNITLLEKLDRVGGNAESVAIPGRRNLIDVGPQFFSPLAQPTYSANLDELSLLDNITSADAGVTIYNSMSGPVRFHVPKTFGELLLQLLLKPKALDDWAQFAIFSLSSVLYDLTAKDPTETVNDWLNQWPQSSLSPEFKRNVLMPFLYQLIVVTPNSIKDCSAYFTLTYYAASVMEAIISIAGVALEDLIEGLRELTRIIAAGPRGKPDQSGSLFSRGLFKVDNSLIGLDGILEQVLEKIAVSPVLSTPVTRVEQAENGVVVHMGESSIPADHVVFACHPYAAARLLDDQRNRELRNTLKGFPYVRFPIHMQNESTCYLPAENDDSPREAVNIVTIEDNYQFTVCFEYLRSNPAQWKAFKSWGNPTLIPDDCDSTFLAAHRRGVFPTARFIHSQQELENFQGRNNLWFAGGYTNWYDSQESAARSAVKISRLIDEVEGRKGASASVPSALPMHRRFAGLPEALEKIVRSFLPRIPIEIADDRKQVLAVLLDKLKAALQNQ